MTQLREEGAGWLAGNNIRCTSSLVVHDTRTMNLGRLRHGCQMAHHLTLAPVLPALDSRKDKTKSNLIRSFLDRA